MRRCAMSVESSLPASAGDAVGARRPRGAGALIRIEADVTVVPGLRGCELRRSRMIDTGTDLVCGAGGFALGVAGRDDAAITATCVTCPIPDEMTDRWACLHLRPIRVERDGRWESFFSCRWFYELNLERQPRSLGEQCYGCVYWFPRPEVELMKGYWQEAERIRSHRRSGSLRGRTTRRQRNRRCGAGSAGISSAGSEPGREAE